jgi:hypothetical protein
LEPHDLVKTGEGTNPAESRLPHSLARHWSVYPLDLNPGTQILSWRFFATAAPPPNVSVNIPRVVNSSVFGAAIRFIKRDLDRASIT